MWSSTLVRWLVNFVQTVVGSNPSHGCDRDSRFVCHCPMEGCLNPVGRKMFLRCLPVYCGITSAAIHCCNGASPEVFRKKHLFPERSYLKNPFIFELFHSYPWLLFGQIQHPIFGGPFLLSPPPPCLSRRLWSRPSLDGMASGTCMFAESRPIGLGTSRERILTRRIL